MNQSTIPSHPLYPVNQVFLWLPGLPGNEVPHCSYNHNRPLKEWNGGVCGELMRCDGNQAPYAPPYPVSPASFISWHTHVSPPFPYHALPISHTLSPAEMDDLANRVISRINGDPGDYQPLTSVLRNDLKLIVIAALAEMGLLERPHGLSRNPSAIAV